MRIDAKSFDRVEGGRIEVLRDVAFSLEPGSFTCLTGPSGCGKTTALRILLGLDDDYRGAVRLPARDTRLAAVFQEPRLLPWRTVEQNVRLALPRTPRRAAETLPDPDDLFERLGLTAMRTAYPHELSLGLARRVALARAFAIAPDVLALDEPFVSLDEPVAERLRALLLDLWRARRVTVLMVTHNLREAIELADRLLILDGRPARLVGDEPIAMARDARDRAARDSLLEGMARRHPETMRF